MKIVQIGTNVGNDDLTNLLVNVHPELLILVEPFSQHNDKINDCYKHITNKIIENIVIVPDNKTECDFYYHPDDPEYKVASLDRNHVIKHGYLARKIKIQTLKCMNINDLFDKYNLIDIDILFMDIEGMDDSVLRAINYNKYNIKKIYYENLHLPYPQINTHDFMRNHGYTVTPNIGINDWSSLAEK
jgi:FkbM family methyltransferase